MKPFIKTLVGDVRNVAVVALVIAIGTALTRSGHPEAAWLLMPIAVLTGVAWLARYG